MRKTAPRQTTEVIKTTGFIAHIAAPSVAAHIVAVVAFDRISPFHLSVPCVVFGEGNGPDDPPRFDLRVCAIEPGPLTTNAGFTIGASHGLAALVLADTIVIPSWRDVDETPPAALLDALRAAHRRGAQLVGLCLGAFVLAQAGLLDGRPATTHWAWADAFARRFPQVRLDPDVLYVDDGDILTSAGTAAGLDCCLHVLRKRHGSRAANEAARRLVVPPHRQGGQAQYVQQPVAANPRTDRLAVLIDWVRAHLNDPHTLEALARRVLMSRRTFTRHFRQATGMTVGAWLTAERLTRAQHLLETTDLQIDRVALAVGFGSSVALRQHFAAAFRTSPSAYRRTFRGS